MTKDRGKVNASISIDILRIDIRTPLKQQPSNLQLASETSNMQGRPLALSKRVHLSVIVQHHLGDPEMTLVCSHVQSGPVLLVVRVNIRGEFSVFLLVYNVCY